MVNAAMTNSPAPETLPAVVAVSEARFPEEDPLMYVPVVTSTGAVPAPLSSKTASSEATVPDTTAVKPGGDSLALASFHQTSTPVWSVPALLFPTGADSSCCHPDVPAACETLKLAAVVPPPPITAIRIFP